MPGSASEQRAKMMLEEPISKVIPRLALPTIVSMLISSVYNMADTYFVSQIGTSASGAVGVIFSAMSLIQAVAFMFGMGAGTNVSQALGAGMRSVPSTLRPRPFSRPSPRGFSLRWCAT